MAQSIISDAKGLYTYPSDVSGVPVGSAAVALNVNINRKGVIESRRGFDNLAYALPSSSDRLLKLYYWQSSIFGLYGTTFSYYNPASGWTSRGTIAAAANATSVRAVASQNKNFYILSSTGLYKTDAVATSIYAAGVPKALIITLAVSGAGTALANNYYATYQCLFARKDANSNIVYGGVSGTFEIQNTAGSTQNVTARCYLPSGLDTSNFIQLYRTATSATTPFATGPQQCYEVALSAGNISAGYIDITDIVPDAQLGATIYTDSSQQGIAYDNGTPPLATDMAEFKSYMFYSDITFKHQFQFNLLAVSGTGLVNTDTIVITQGATIETYTGGGAENVGTKTFKVTTSGSVSQNIDATIKSFASIVNQGSAIVVATVVPYSALNTFPGKCSLEARTLTTTAFTAVCAARAAAFSPQLASPAISTNTSTQDAFQNGLAFSKAGQPESVPRVQVLKVGSADDRILRIQTLREGLLIYKQYGGIHVLRGTSAADFSIQLLDSTAKLVAPDSLAVVNNTAFGLFEAGICRVDDSNVSIISDRIKDQILPLFGSATLALLKSLSFGYGSDTDGKYILSIPQLSTDTYTKRQIVYDLFNDTFVNWDLQLYCGGVNPVDNKTLLGRGASEYILSEKRAFDYTDYSDTSSTALTIASYSGTTVYLNHTDLLTVGDIISQGSTAVGYIESINTSLGSVVIDVAQTWTVSVADVSLLKAISCKWQWNADSGGAPSGFKNYYEASLITKQAWAGSASLIFSSDVNPGEITTTLTSELGNGAFGQFDFGYEVFGGDQARSPKRLGIPRGMARCNQLSVRFETRVANSDFQLTGISLSFTPVSTRTTR